MRENDEMAIDLLIVDDDDEFRRTTVQYFEKMGFNVRDAANGEQAMQLATAQVFHAAILDLRMPGMSGIDVLQQLRDDNIETEVVVLSGEGTIETAVEAMKLGAHDFLTKPVRYKQLNAVVDRAVEAGQLRKENRQLRAVIEQTRGPASMIGQSKKMRDVYRLIERTGPSNKPILIQGESGTGKELVAKALHQASGLSGKPLVVVNCAALPESLLESELFGHEKGAFTVAASSKPGLFEIADGGTLFIDEVGELAASLQPKLLRVLEDGWMRRIGSVKDRRVDVRILAATNRNLAAEVAVRRFREDLYYRINVMTILLPPLRERGDDVLLLADHLTGPGWEWDSRARGMLTSYAWPGNVRQLANAIERAKILADDEIIRFDNFPPEVTRTDQGTAKGVISDADANLASVNRALVVQAMQREHGNKMRAARTLGVSRRSLYRLLEKYRIDVQEYSE